MHNAGSAPVVRIPLRAFDIASRALDFGAEAIIAPMINTADDARHFVAATKYPPGRRAQLGSDARDGAAGQDLGGRLLA
ncbi:MAG: aldolase/citrate lyase family protein [Pseudolabrys sp.]